MLDYNKIDISEGIYPTKSKRKKESMVCHQCFFNQGFTFQKYVCNSGHDLCLNLSNIAIMPVKSVDYCCIFYKISKFEAILLLENHGFRFQNHICNIGHDLAMSFFFNK